MCECSYDDIKLIDSNIFDGSFVLTFDAHVIEEKKDLTEKFKTKDLDEKYKYRSPKGNSVDIFAADRRAKENNEIDIDNMSETTFKL